MAIIKRMEEVTYHACDLCGREERERLTGGTYIEVNGAQKMVCVVCKQQLLGIEKKEEKPWEAMTRKERKELQKRMAEKEEQERLRKVAEEEGL